jgi:alanine racemase
MDRGYIYVNKNNIQHNIDYLNNLTGSELCIVVKANAYGHGIDWTVNTAIESGVVWFAVAAIDEAILVRSISDNIRILLLSEPYITELEKLAIYNIDTTVYNESFIEALGESQHSFKVHLKIDTGMHRVGCSPDEFELLYKKISSFKNLALEGICTHFPVADTDEIQTNNSIKMFKNTISNIDIKNLLIHADNSASTTYNNEKIFNMTRVGLAAYGYSLSPVSVASKLKPVMEIKTRISNIQIRKKGESVSYGKAHILQKDSLIATAPIGYGDGYPWNSFPDGKVIVNNRFCRLIGRVTMDQILFDVTGMEVEINDEVTILGASLDSNIEISIKDIAEWNNTIEWEILTNIKDNRLNRVEIEN